ncbi:hypothetical protein L211DRAFT_410507 [Terfezia boudieri ATCC MYA-4762]|uniref:DUF7918 domain-containing protein n=1 Tax=Terfezia boudieri ATCC MYA-4762 TaxID=1051890 RepID=A0A3N4LG98_9PEZI|nr:hypothetical protein L211DRAFT_410507 [Terfezia boudieri ATCC MYA-4762]
MRSKTSQLHPALIIPEYVWETPYLGIRVWVDGVSLSPSTHRLSKNHPTLKLVDRELRKPGDDDVVYRSALKFGKLEIVDDDAALNQHISDEELKHLGTILIHFYRGTDSPHKPAAPVKPTKAARPEGSKKTPVAPTNSPSIPSQSLTKVPEKKLKGQDIAYGVQFGPARAVVNSRSRPSPNTRSWMLVDAQDKPFVTFRFLYRSEKALQSLGVLPRQEALRPESKPIMAISPRIRIESPSSSSATKNERIDNAPSQSSQAAPRAKKRKIEFVDLTELS